MRKEEYTVLDGFFSDENLVDSQFVFNDEDFSDKQRMSDPIFKSIGYPSKIYYKNIQKYITSYTKPGAIVMDSCAGSGSTGLAALLTGRRAILIDDSPLAINMEYNLINYVDLKVLEKEYKKLIKTLEGEINDIYFTKTKDGKPGYADVIIASNVYTCPKCAKEIVLYKNETGKRSEYKCRECGEIINIATQEIKELQIDKRRPVEVKVIPLEGGKKEVKEISEEDKKIWSDKLNKYNEKYGALWAPEEHIVYNRAYPRVGGWPGFPIDSTVSDLFPKNNLLALKILNNYIENEIEDIDVKNFMKFIFLEILFRTSSRLFTGSGIKNVYHIPPVGKEQNVLTVFKRKYMAISKAKDFLQSQLNKDQTEKDIRIIKCDAKKNPVRDNSIDYAFIDPPYGGMVPYAELNLFYSAWLNEKEDLANEIIIPMDYEKKEGYVELWGKYIEQAFGEVFRTLKPGAHFTVAFHSTFSNIWNELKNIMQVRLGFEFVNMVENERGNTFHTNNINDTNPVSAFITYKKPDDGKPHISQIKIKKNVFELFDTGYLKAERTFRAIQSKIIKMVNEYDLNEVPDDKAIENWLNAICVKNENKYILK
ncbi:MAG: hypothetical protein KH020_10880 [Clostridiales bacterium]|nr:hypothetical protein [Clostridiales bacterium]